MHSSSHRFATLEVNATHDIEERSVSAQMARTMHSSVPTKKEVVHVAPSSLEGVDVTKRDEDISYHFPREAEKPVTLHEYMVAYRPFGLGHGGDGTRSESDDAVSEFSCVREDIADPWASDEIDQ